MGVYILPGKMFVCSLPWTINKHTLSYRARRNKLYKLRRNERYERLRNTSKVYEGLAGFTTVFLPQLHIEELTLSKVGKITILCFQVTSSLSEFINQSNPAEVLVSSDIRPSKNLTFYDS